jgi:hypothetical protein
MVFISILILFASIGTVNQGYFNLHELVVNILDSRGATTTRPIIIPFFAIFLATNQASGMRTKSNLSSNIGDIVLLNSSTDEYASSYIFTALLLFVIMIWVEKLRLCFIGASSCTLHTSIVSTTSYL